MAGNQHRKIKKAEKRRKKRRQAQTSRGSRKVLGMTADRMERARNWPIWDCWASQNWHEQGAHVYCCFARKHDDGTIAAAMFEIDLEEKGVLEVATRTTTNASDIHAELARVSGDDLAMVSVDPTLVVQLVDSARDLGRENGHDQPNGLNHARRLFGSTRASKGRHEILTGKHDPSAPKPDKPSGGGWFDGVKNALGLG